MGYKFLILYLVAFSVISCSEYPCTKGDLRFTLIGFSDTESDTIILRRFQKNSLVIKDSFSFTPLNPIRFARFGDTLTMTAYLSDALMQSDYDYQLFFPGAGRMFHITDIKEKQSYSNRSGLFSTTKEGCVNPITGCNVDGMTVSTNIFPNIIYLKK
jgi:hypothetical protein